MKTRQRRSPARKRTGFGECSQSNKIAKDSQCQPKTCPQAVELRPPSVDMNQAGPCNSIPCDDCELSEASNCADTLFNVPLPATSSYLLETIFSPTLEPAEFQRQKLVYSCAIPDVENPAVPDLVCDETDDSCGSLLDDEDFSSSCFRDANVSTASLSAAEDVCPDETLVSYSGLEDEFIHPEVIFDVSDRCMILPFLKDIAVTNGVDDAESNEGAILDSDGACLFMAVHQARATQQQIGYNCCYEGIEDISCFDPQLFISNCLDISEAVPSYLPLLLPNQTRKRKLITLVLDLDETLVHSTLDYCPDADFTFPVYFDMKEQTVYVRQRPHLYTFLERVAQMFEIIIFTASQSIYGEQLLNILDPDQKIISQRVYRESCIFSQGSYMKDLTVLGRDLAKVVIIDNTPQVFQLQVNNGIPIESWFDDPTDSALLSILPFLETLASADDVRPIIAKRFGTRD